MEQKEVYGWIKRMNERETWRDRERDLRDGSACCIGATVSVTGRERYNGLYGMDRGAQCFTLTVSHYTPS